jgi:hypothetical protein
MKLSNQLPFLGIAGFAMFYFLITDPDLVLATICITYWIIVCAYVVVCVIQMYGDQLLLSKGDVPK